MSKVRENDCIVHWYFSLTASIRGCRLLCRDESISLHLLATVTLLSSTCWSTNATTVLGSPTGTGGSTLPLLNTNQGIRISDDDTLYVADSANDRIITLPMSISSTPSIFAEGFGTGLTQMKDPADVFLTPTSVYVADRNNYRIMKWAKNGSSPVIVAGNTNTPGTALNRISWSYFIFVDLHANLYVSDTDNHRVLLFNASSSNGSNGEVIAGDGTGASNNHQLNNPNGIFVNGNGTLYIADLRNNRIQRWYRGASAGSRVAGDGTNGSSLSQLFFPTSVLVDSNEYIYVVQLKHSRVTRWTVNATFGVCIAGCTGVLGAGPNQLNSAQSLAFDSNGSLYVSDQGNNRVQKFQIIGDCGKYTHTLGKSSSRTVNVF